MRATKERETTTPAQLCKAASGLPEVVERSSTGSVAFSVRNKEFVSLTDDGHVQLHLLEDDTKDALKDHRSAERLERRGKPVGVRVPLAELNGQALNYLVRRAWYARAPKRLAESMAEADSAEPGEVGDLPRSIGRPAAQALAGAGITSLAEVANRSEKEISALHGVGPKAVRILAEALAERGLALQSDRD